MTVIRLLNQIIDWYIGMMLAHPYQTLAMTVMVMAIVLAELSSWEDK